MVGPDNWAVSNISIKILANSSFSYLSHNMEITQTQVLLIHWPKSQHTKFHLHLTQLEANTPYAYVLFQSFSQRAFWTKSKSSSIAGGCLLYLLDVADGYGEVLGHSWWWWRNLWGNQAGTGSSVLWRKWHKGVKENNDSPAHIRNPKYLSCLSVGGGNERVKSRSEGNNNSFK